MHQLHSGDAAPWKSERLDKRARAWRRRILTAGQIWIERLVAVVANSNLHAAPGRVTQRSHKLIFQQIAEAHVVEREIEARPRHTDEVRKARHDRAWLLFAFGQKQDGELILRGVIHISPGSTDFLFPCFWQRI